MNELFRDPAEVDRLVAAQRASTGVVLLCTLPFCRTCVRLKPVWRAHVERGLPPTYAAVFLPIARQLLEGLAARHVPAVVALGRDGYARAGSVHDLDALAADLARHNQGFDARGALADFWARRGPRRLARRDLRAPGRYFVPRSLRG